MHDNNCSTPSMEDPEHILELRHLTIDDYADVKELMDIVYSQVGGAWPLKNFQSQLNVFPEGQICIEDKGKVVAAAISVIIDYDKFGDKHTYEDITGDAYMSTHDPKGDVLYGVDLFVSPEYRQPPTLIPTCKFRPSMSKKCCVISAVILFPIVSRSSMHCS